MNLYGEEFLRKPTYTDMEKLYAYHDEKHGFPGMLENIDCIGWPWENCLVRYKAQFYRGDHRLDPFILLEMVASNDLWIWHAFVGVSGMNNDVNVLRQSPFFNDLKSGKAPDVPFVANNGTVVSFSGAKERHEKIERLITPVVVPFSLAPYITASAVENGTRNRTAHHSSGGAILAPLGFFCLFVI
uniref:Protein ALP1-like n=1 Tax=Tanacetum cinerariifolium TaxID=118510 RepID=A0A699I9M6_TANCI|nr:hypothetical protein [Tanacetum cinerariifolium]